MCCSPITIDNPYYKIGGKGYLKLKTGKYKEVSFGQFNKLHNTRDSKIQVPCGCCPQCISNRQGYLNQRVQMESIRSHLFMLTLTYNNESLFHTNCGEYMVAYPYYKDVQDMFKRLRKQGHKLRYLCVSEYGKKNRPHFHLIVAIEKSPDWDGTMYEPRHLEFVYGKLFLKEWRRNYGTSRVPIYDNLCTYTVGRDGRRNYDFHYIIPLPGHDSDCSFYVSKYLWKYDKRIQDLLVKIKLDSNLDDIQTKRLISALKPRCVISKDFGSWKLDSTKSYISKCLSKDADLPQFFDIYTGKNMLMSPYYRNHLLPVEYRISQFERNSIAKEYDSYELENKDTMLECSIQSENVYDMLHHSIRIKSELNRKY